MDEILKILRELDWSPLYISLKTGVVATIISFFLGIFAARKVVKAGPRVKAIADGILTLPMVLRPRWLAFSFCFYSAADGLLESFSLKTLTSKWCRPGLGVSLRRQ